MERKSQRYPCYQRDLMTMNTIKRNMTSETSWVLYEFAMIRKRLTAQIIEEI